MRRNDTLAATPTSDRVSALAVYTDDGNGLNGL